jgi:hypothetical protein
VEGDVAVSGGFMQVPKSDEAGAAGLRSPRVEIRAYHGRDGVSESRLAWRTLVESVRKYSESRAAQRWLRAG